MSEEFNAEQFDVQVPWDTIPLSDTVDAGLYVLRVRELKMSVSKDAGKLMVALYATIDEGIMSGVQFPIQNFVVGTDEDPLADRDPNTWKKSFGARQLNQLMEKCNVARDRSLKITLARAVGCRCQAYVTKTVEDRGDYAGQDRNRVTRWGAYGEHMIVPGVPKSHPAAGPGQTVTPTVPRQRARPMVNGQIGVQHHEEDEGENNEPVTAQVVAEGEEAVVVS